jgi:molybdopterin synthase catalytic subunit
MDYLKLTFDKLDPTEISELCAHESCGAVSLFVGTTRDNFQNKQVLNIVFDLMTVINDNFQFQGRQARI